MISTECGKGCNVYIFREMTMSDYQGAFSLWAGTDGMGIGESDTE